MVTRVPIVPSSGEITGRVKLAVTPESAVMVKEQVHVPVHADAEPVLPDQPVNVEPKSATAVSIIDVPGS